VYQTLNEEPSIFHKFFQKKKKTEEGIFSNSFYEYNPQKKKVFANHIFDKGTVPRIHKEHSQLNNKKTTQFKNGQRI